MRRLQWYKRGAAYEQIARELKDPTCTILRLCYFEHLTYQQAADRLGISPNTVKKHISKALAILRERMKHTNIENRRKNHE